MPRLFRAIRVPALSLPLVLAAAMSAPEAGDPAGTWILIENEKASYTLEAKNKDKNTWSGTSDCGPTDDGKECKHKVVFHPGGKIEQDGRVLIATWRIDEHEEPSKRRMIIRFAPPDRPPKEYAHRPAVAPKQ